MHKVIHRADSRGAADHGWLKSRHTFSFADYYDPERMNFGALRVLNDDVISGGSGFGTHPHQNMEIVSIPLSGSLKHRDSTGETHVIAENDVQLMSAGTGISHSEFNGSPTEPTNFLQIWILPKRLNVPPRYHQKTFDASSRNGRFQTVISPDGKDGSLVINQDAYFSLAVLENGAGLTYNWQIEGNGLYLFVLRGAIESASERLEKRDALGLTGANEVSLRSAPTHGGASEILAIEVPMTLK